MRCEADAAKLAFLAARNASLAPLGPFLPRGSYCSFRLTKPPRGDSLAEWSDQGQSVAKHGPLPRGENQNRLAPARRESQELQKMKNSGNEAKKYLKTKDITFLSAAKYAHFARKFAQIKH